MDAWLPFGRMPREGNHLAGPGRLAGRQSSLDERLKLQEIFRESTKFRENCMMKVVSKN